MKKRVVITGLGAVTPIGIGVQEFWINLCAGKSGVSKITKFDISDFQVKTAAEVKNFDPSNWIKEKEIKKMDTFIHYAIAASDMCMKDSGFKVDSSNCHRIGVFIGSGIGGLPAIEAQHKVYLERGSKRISPFFIPSLIINLASGQVSIRFGAKGPNSAVATACATGLHAIGDSYRMIVNDEADAMIAGGAESVITPLAVGGFQAMRALSTSFNDTPSKASRPFDKLRDGFVIGEGAGIVLLEELEHAKRRDAKVYAEVIGYSLNGDAYHITAPSPNGEGAARCMAEAIRVSGIKTEDIDYINAHGTSTPLNDKSETDSIKIVFKEHAYKLAISSIKSMIGHLLGAAGGAAVVSTVLSIANGILPPTINQENPDPECDLDYVPNTSRKRDINLAMINSFGFGGTNASIIIKKFKDE
ncbi:beta-ketoacyl-ACP synthase II [bacterium]|nr:beta-ketoacyl-ACP synthase II [bacterium]